MCTVNVSTARVDDARVTFVDLLSTQLSYGTQDEYLKLFCATK